MGRATDNAFQSLHFTFPHKSTWSVRGQSGGGRGERFSWNNFKFLSLTVLGTLLKYFSASRSILMIVFGGRNGIVSALVVPPDVCVCVYVCAGHLSTQVAAASCKCCEFTFT